MVVRLRSLLICPWLFHQMTLLGVLERWESGHWSIGALERWGKNKTQKS